MPEIGVTVVVATRDRPAYLVDTLRDLLAQRHRPLQILVVDQSETQDPRVSRFIDRHTDLIAYHRVSSRGLPQARNHGWRAARHPAILFVDDDIRCGPELVAAHLEALDQPGVAVVAGAVEPDPDRPAAVEPPSFSLWTGMPRGGFADRARYPVEHACGVNFSLWSDALARVGGFDEIFDAGAALYEELDLCLRIRELGLGISFNGEARVEHRRAPTGGCRLGEMSDYVHGLAHNRTVLIRRHLRRLRRPIAICRLLLTGISFALRYRQPGLVAACVSGCRAGLASAETK